jgi:very-short-patch-repair endonuclease
MRRIRGVSQSVQEAALELRREQTPEEIALWEALRDRQLSGVKFRRQAPMGRFILDFYAPSHKLMVGLDGAHHQKQVERDSERTAHLAAQGLSVLRFSNGQIHADFAGVITTIEKALKEGTK